MWDFMLTTDPEYLSDGYRVGFHRNIHTDTGEEESIVEEDISEEDADAEEPSDEEEPDEEDELLDEEELEEELGEEEETEYPGLRFKVN